MRNNNDFSRRRERAAGRGNRDPRPFVSKSIHRRKGGNAFENGPADEVPGKKDFTTRQRSRKGTSPRTHAPRTAEEGIRLNRYLANAGLCSRRDADIYIQAGVVKINGKVVTELGTKVKPGDVVRFNDAVVRNERKVYILLNKPKNTVTTTDDPEGRKTVMDIIAGACHERVFPVGRLDRNTMGVLLLTNDGELTDRLTHPRFHKKKIYHVFLSKPLSREHFDIISNGFVLDDGFIKADALEYVEGGEGKQVGIEIHSGRNRIVRRIFEHFGYGIEKLDRVYFAGLTKYNLPRGHWRFLTDTEIAMLKSGRFE